MKNRIQRWIIYISIVTMIFPLAIYADDETEELGDINVWEELAEASTEETKEPVLNSRAAVIYDRKSKQVIWGKQENEKRPMASTTKIMTAIIVLEKAKLTDVVTISKKAAGTGGSRLKMQAGDKITVHDLLYALLLISGNDCAVALAEHVGGSVEGFAVLMNQKVKELNLTNTNFVTPHGLDMPEHYTTAFELAKLADYALQNTEFAKMVNTKNYTITLNGYSRNLNNTNELLGNLEGVNGVKTGFTNGANRCLVTSVNREGMNIITVVLGADTKKFRTSDSIKLIQYAYSNYAIINIKEQITESFEQWRQINEKRVEVIRGVEPYLELILEEVSQEYIPVKKEEQKDIKIEIECVSKIETPIQAEEQVGKLKVKIKEKEVMNIAILNKKEIKRMGIWDYFKDLLKNNISYMERI